MRWILWAGLLLGLLGGAPSAFSQDVFVVGKLQIGFGDQDNVVGVRLNNAMPFCAGGGELVNPGTIGTTQGTLLVNARAQAASGVGGTITFHAVGGTMGGAQQKTTSTCRSATEPFANPRLRSRTRIASAHFPARKGVFTSMIASAPTPDPPVASYQLHAGGGPTAAITRTTWTTMATPAASPVVFTGQAFQRTPPNFIGGSLSTLAVHRFQPGPARFGGGVPMSASTAAQIGIYLSTPSVPPTQYGQLQYVNGLYRRAPLFIGTNYPLATHDLSPSNFSPFPFPDGLVFARQNMTFAARTPGGTTIDQQGAVRTLNGGNTVTPQSGPLPTGSQIVSPLAVQGLFHGWTTGAVTHTNREGDFTTIRKAAGFDLAVNASTAVAGETRRLQVVSPWSAAVRPFGVFGLPVPPTTRGGVAVLTLNVIPVPEAGTPSLLGVGAGLLLAAARRARSA